VLLPVLLAALRTLGDAPARSLTALAQRLGVAEADAAAVVEAREAEPAPVATPEAPVLRKNPLFTPLDEFPPSCDNRRGDYPCLRGTLSP
jgi:hypothetical protein